jgi:hypothetical protein
MWRSSLSLPLVVRVIAWVTVGFLGLTAMAKAKAIQATLTALWKAASERFWNWVRTKLAVDLRGTSGRTYKGRFEDYWYIGSPHDAWFFSLSHNGVRTTVPVLETQMLATVKRGTLVEVDTEVLSGVESVQRVRAYDQFT